MKNIIILIIGLLQLVVFGQQSFEISYQLLIKGYNKGEYILNTNESLSNWICVKQNPDADMNLLDAKSFLFLKDKKSKMIYYQDNVLTKKIFVKDSINQMNWNITNNEKKILNFVCKEARTTFRGREFIAYYTEDIALNDGPWKFGGLPGLILEVKSTDGYLSYYAYKITKTKKQNITLSEYKDKKYLSWDEYSTLFIKIYDNYINSIRTSGDVSFGSEANIKVGRTEIIYPKIQKDSGYAVENN